MTGRLAKHRFAAFALLAALSAFLFCLAGCGAGRRAPDAQESVPASVNDGDITVTITARPHIVGAGDPIELSIAVVNGGSEPRTFELPSAQAFDFAAHSGGEEVWRWSSGMSFAQVLTPLTIEGGASRVYRASWDIGGTKPGTCRITGTFAGLPHLEPVAEVTISE